MDFIIESYNPELSNSSGHQQFFNLDAQIFERATHFGNMPENLKGLKRLLFADSEQDLRFVTLFSSPIHAVNMGDMARLKARLPFMRG